MEGFFIMKKEDFPYTPEEAVKKLNIYLRNAGLAGKFGFRHDKHSGLVFIKDKYDDGVIYPPYAVLGFIEIAETADKKMGSPDEQNRLRRKVKKGPGRYSDNRTGREDDIFDG
jgi:hypothetical protein